MSYLVKILHESVLHTASINKQLIKNDTLKKILKHMELNFKKPLYFQSICTDYGISPSYLSQSFQKELGMTFTAYLTELRITYAKYLLETTTIPISEIATSCGYEQFYYFSKIFKKHEGCTPSHYRNNSKANL